MNAQIVLLWTIVAATWSAAILRAEEGPAVIRNRYLEIRADRATGEITILAKGKPVVVNGRAGEAHDKASVFVMQSDGLSPSALSISSSNGISSTVVLPTSSPFAIIRTNVSYHAKEGLSIDKLSIFRGTLVSDSSTDNRKLLGTGGLTAPGKKVGSYMWLAVAEPQSRSGIVAGFTTTDRGSGVVFAEKADDKLQFDALLELGHLTVKPDEALTLGPNAAAQSALEVGRLTVKPDKTLAVDQFVIGYFDDVHDGLEAWADAVAKEYKIKLPPQPCGYCTWYHAGASNENALTKQTQIAAKELKPYGFGFEQIDDGWQDGISKNGPCRNFTRARSNGPYPSGMKQTAEMIHSHGLTPGIWFMPFAGTWYDPWFKDHQDWFVKRADGTPYETAWGGTCMDMTNPDARKYVSDYVHQLSHDWGYRFFKMDGLSTGCAVQPQYVNLAYKDDHLGDAVLHDPSQTNIEAFRSGLKLVREAAGPDVFLLGCCAAQNMRSYGGSFGLVDAMRVGPDNHGGSWHGVLTGPRIASRHYQLNGRVWYNDPDVVYVRKSLTLDQARANASWVAITGQLFIVSDDFSKLTRDRLDILKHVMPAHGCPARPVDLLEEEIPRIWHVSDTRGPARRDVVALFNWDEKQPWDVDYSLDRLGLPEAKSYVAYDFWGDRLLPPVSGRFKAALPKSSCLILAVRPESDHPQLISTSRHVTQGMIDVTDENWDATTETLSGTSKLVPGDLYELRIATGGKWQTASITSNIDSLKPTVKTEDGLVRVRLAEAAKEPVDWNWKIKMAKSE